MENLIAAYLFERYTLLISSTCAQVPLGWQDDVEIMLRTLNELPTEVRCLLMIDGILVDSAGDLVVSLVACLHLMAPDGVQRIRDAYAVAKESVKTRCVDCGARGILIDAREGRRVLCLVCQDKRGIICHGC